ncbi:hypothetical protein FQN50_003107 [Emmonsiellopsis sp. PD_5]|nr:hypothetical protein FQN50_003107 [Emmonsiellopsis sp. PD_5]
MRLRMKSVVGLCQIVYRMSTGGESIFRRLPGKKSVISSHRYARALLGWIIWQGPRPKDNMPERGYKFTAGKATEIIWSPTTDGKVTVKIYEYTGDLAGITEYTYGNIIAESGGRFADPILDSIPNTGRTLCTPSFNSLWQGTYIIAIIDDDTHEFSTSPPFTVAKTNNSTGTAGVLNPTSPSAIGGSSSNRSGLTLGAKVAMGVAIPVGVMIILLLCALRYRGRAKGSRANSRKSGKEEQSDTPENAEDLSDLDFQDQIYKPPSRVEADSIIIHEADSNVARQDANNTNNRQSTPTKRTPLNSSPAQSQGIIKHSEILTPSHLSPAEDSTSLIQESDPSTQTSPPTLTPNTNPPTDREISFFPAISRRASMVVHPDGTLPEAYTPPLNGEGDNIDQDAELGQLRIRHENAINCFQRLQELETQKVGTQEERYAIARRIRLGESVLLNADK